MKHLVIQLSTIIIIMQRQFCSLLVARNQIRLRLCLLTGRLGPMQADI